MAQHLLRRQLHCFLALSCISLSIDLALCGLHFNMHDLLFERQDWMHRSRLFFGSMGEFVAKTPYQTGTPPYAITEA
ncbi:hypothetical protein JAAARDRAFT_485874 [Jaapia argillacea MUCL 33604]|uniref:Uncharacterized protein n=1 Tax=Jaapia argillacea MUCL 33604 TaxID=933084 RepID=A0A067PM51_9AGAM|nr:hypothetical protein JAAARDRAFT_485874 [Jaapia argillacea MUCL 33604]